MHPGDRTRRSTYDPARHGPHRVVDAGFHADVYAAVKAIPAGKVTTYGDVAAALGLRSVARQVGWALAAIPEDRDDVPWHRVVNARGEISRRGDGLPSEEQRRLLADEGVEVNEAGRVVGFSDRRV